MALKSTIFKATLQIADIDHNHYATHALTLARHPSETDERMMVRLVALSLQAHQLQDLCNGDGVLGFGAGLSDPDEPDVMLRDFTERTRLWVEVGQPDDKPLVKACSKADAVVVYAYGPAAEVWWKGIASKLERLDKLSVWRLPHESVYALKQLAERNMQLQATVQEGEITLSSSLGRVHLVPVQWQAARTR